MEALQFEMRVDGVPYVVRATPYTFNTETRFYVSYNGSGMYVFAWDSELKRLAAIGDDAATIPDSLEQAIASKLQSSVDGQFA